MVTMGKVEFNTRKRVGQSSREWKKNLRKNLVSSKVLIPGHRGEGGKILRKF